MSNSYHVYAHTHMICSSVSSTTTILSECTCEILFSDDEATTVCGGQGLVFQLDYTFDPNSNTPALTAERNVVFTCIDGEDDLGIWDFSLAEDGSLELETTEGFGATFWRNSPSVNALPVREEPSPTPTPTTLEPTKKPTPNLGGPSVTPYYQSFENGDFPFFGGEDQVGDPFWGTANNDDDPTKVWIKTDEEAVTGSFSIKTPLLENEKGTTSSSNLTLTLPDYGVPGELFFSAWAGTQQPLDVFEWYVDGGKRGEVAFADGGGFESSPPGPIAVGPGEHTYDFVYTFNKLGLTFLPPDGVFPNRTGVVYIDDVYFVPNV